VVPGTVVVGADVTGTVVVVLVVVGADVVVVTVVVVDDVVGGIVVVVVVVVVLLVVVVGHVTVAGLLIVTDRLSDAVFWLWFAPVAHWLYTVTTTDALLAGNGPMATGPKGT